MRPAGSTVLRETARSHKENPVLDLRPTPIHQAHEISRKDFPTVTAPTSMYKCFASRFFVYLVDLSSLYTITCARTTWLPANPVLDFGLARPANLPGCVFYTIKRFNNYLPQLATGGMQNWILLAFSSGETTTRRIHAFIFRYMRPKGVAISGSLWTAIIHEEREVGFSVYIVCV